MFNNSSHIHKWVYQEQIPFIQKDKKKIALLDGQIVVMARKLTESDLATVNKDKLKEIIITDPSGQKVAVKIKHLAKAIHLSEKKVRYLVEEGGLEDHLSTLEKSLEHKESGLSLKKLIKISSKAAFVLKENESIYVRIGFSKVLATRDGEGDLLVSKKVKVLGSGSFGKVSLFKSVLGNTAVKFAINDLEAREDVKIEYENLNYIHGEESRHTPGIQDKPYLIITIFSKRRKGKVRKQGYMGALYAGDGKKIKGKIKGPQTLRVADQLFKGLAAMHSKKVFHGDIKPENMLVRINENSTNKYIVHISDLGGARILDDQTPINDFFTSSYTEEYSCKEDHSARKEIINSILENKLSQEGYRAKIQELCAKKDVYSISVSLCELITGDKKPKVNKLINKGVPGPVANLIIKGLSKDYKMRPYPQEFLQAINQALPKTV